MEAHQSRERQRFIIDCYLNGLRYISGEWRDLPYSIEIENPRTRLPNSKTIVWDVALDIYWVCNHFLVKASNLLK